MRLVPAVLVPDAQLGAVIKERFAAGGLSPRQHSVVERRQPPPVLVVWRCSQRQQDLHRDAVVTVMQWDNNGILNHDGNTYSGVQRGH